MKPAKLAKDYSLDQRAAENLISYLREQQAATRVVPSDETIVVERFRDEIGDWRLCVLSPYGGRVHSAWGLALSAKIRNELDVEADAIWSDDGIVIHMPDADEPPPSDLVLLEPDEVEDLVVSELGGSALYGSHFRENAARSLLLPRAYPGKRTPLWQQRLKAQSLLEVARDFPRFPVVLETYREVLKDVLDLPALDSLLRDLQTRKVSLVEVETSTASPFASSLLFDYVATYMYEGDTPNAERRAAALALDRDLLRELLGQEELRELIDPDALVEVEASLQHLTEHGRGKDRDALQVVLRRLGDLTPDECEARVAEGFSAESMLGKLERERSAAKVRINGEERWIVAEDSGLYRDALGVPPAPGLPDTFLEPVPDAMLSLVRRYARTHGPFPTAQLAARYGVDPLPALRELERAGDLVRGELLPGGSEREWCDSEVLRRIRRASVAHLRAEAEPADPRELARFLPAWQNVDAHRPAGRRPRPAARGARAAAGGRPHAGGLGARRAAAPPRRLQPGLARPAHDRGRGRLDRRRRARDPQRQGRALLPRGRPHRRAAARERAPREPAGRDPRRGPRAARLAPLLLGRPDGRHRPLAGGAPRGAVGPGLGRRGDQRRLRASARAAPLLRAQPAAPRPPLRRPAGRDRPGGAGPLVAHLVALRRPAGRAARACAPSPS